jgi:hypothetical protein
MSFFCLISNATHRMYKAVIVSKTSRSKDARTPTFVTHMFLTSEDKTVLPERRVCLQEFLDHLIFGFHLDPQLLKKLHVVSITRAYGSQTFDFFLEFEFAL